MNIGLYQNAAAMSALERWQDAVAQNITSGSKAGYRKRTVEFSADMAGALQSDGSSSADDGGVPALFPRASDGINFMAGNTEHSGNDLDLAIQGDGFFEIQQADGTMAYTRNGQFQARQDHTLVDGSGNPVLSADGNPLTLSQNGGKVTVNADGSIVQGNLATGGEVQIGHIGVFSFAHPENLTAASGGVFTTDADNPANPVEKPNILQGYVENSNVTPMREMVDMVVISRAYEASQKVIHNIDELGQKAVDNLGTA